ncbi:SKA complex subunit 2 [Neosynchiropus ocellatus]
METTVEKLEMMFSKSEADLDYIEKRLRLNFTNNAANNEGSSEENPAVMLENLLSIKAKHAELCSQVKEIAAAQKESMDSIRQNMGTIVDLLQHCQHNSDAQMDLLAKSLPECAEFLGLDSSKAGGGHTLLALIVNGLGEFLQIFRFQ